MNWDEEEWRARLEAMWRLPMIVHLRRGGELNFIEPRPLSEYQLWRHALAERYRRLTHCAYCGNRLPDDWLKCKFCGAPRDD